MDNSWCYPTFWTHLFYIHYIQQEQKGIYIYMYIFYFNCYYFIPSFSFKYTVFSKTIIESFYKQWFKSLSKFSWYYKKNTQNNEDQIIFAFKNTFSACNFENNFWFFTPRFGECVCGRPTRGVFLCTMQINISIASSWIWSRSINN